MQRFDATRTRLRAMPGVAFVPLHGIEVLALSRSGGTDRLCQRGATAVEYALLASLITGVIFLIVGGMGLEVFGLFSDSCHEFANATSGINC
jgi:Flp pilus assembly pilin Flp